MIRLVPDEDVTLALGLAEGIETALAVMEVSEWRPVWSANSAGGVRRFPVLPVIECLTIFTDCDDSGAGLAAAQVCAARWQAAGKAAEVCKPPTGRDWHDSLIAHRGSA